MEPANRDKVERLDPSDFGESGSDIVRQHTKLVRRSAMSKFYSSAIGAAIMMIFQGFFS
jgi:hypothetical protein